MLVVYLLLPIKQTKRLSSVLCVQNQGRIKASAVPGAVRNAGPLQTCMYNQLTG